MVPAYLMESLQDGRVCMYIFEQKCTLYKMTSHFGVLKLIYYKMGGFPPSNHYKMDLENPVYMGLDSSPFYRGNFYEDLHAVNTADLSNLAQKCFPVSVLHPL